MFIAWAVHKELKKTQQPKQALQLINALLPAAISEDITQISKAKELLQLVRPILNDYNIEMNHDSAVASCRSSDVRKILL